MPALKKKRLKATASAAAAAASPSPPSSTPSELSELLLADPVANANLLPRLLALEAVPSDDSSAATTAAACRALALVFQAAGSRGELEGEEASAAVEGEEQEKDSEGAAERSYRRWLRCRFADHARRLRSVLALSGAFPTAQAAAARAALEASRSASTGRFDAGLFGSSLDALLLADCSSSSNNASAFTAPAPASGDAAECNGGSGGGGASAEAISVILSKAGLADVRHSLLRAVARCAAALAASFSSTSSASSPASASASSPSPEALSDAASTLVDVLIRVPPLPELPPREGGGGEGGGNNNNSNSNNNLLLMGVESWCGGEAVARAAAASGASGSRERRKRKQQQQQQQQKGTGAAGTEGGGVAWALPREHRRALRLAWQGALLLPSPSLLPASALSAALRALPGALPGMDRPALLCDALTDAVSGGGGGGAGGVKEGAGGGGGGGASPASPSPASPSSPSLPSASAHAAAVAALSALFELIVRHGLEYPDLYARLYSLLTPQSVGSRDRAQFFTLLDAALASRMVPAYSAASFAKKFARLALTAPPAGALLCLTFVNNVVRRHPATSALLHRRAKAREEKDETLGDERRGDGGGGGGGAERAAAAPRPPSSSSIGSLDPFDPAEPDPSLTRAIESSLWEVAHLAARRHSAPAVAAAARAILRDPGLVPSLAANPKAAAKLASAEADPRPAAAATYGSMAADALAKRVKRAPLVVSSGSGIGRGGRGGRGGDESGEGLMLFGGGAWQKGWKKSSRSSGSADADAGAAALAGEA